MKAPIPTETLSRLLRCNPDTGVLHWRERTPDMFPEPMCRTFNKQFAGKEALTALNKGYRCGRIFDRAAQAHRVAFALYHGCWPVGQVDHIDGNPTNNAANNLREVTNAENHRNERRPLNNTSGTIGVGTFGNRWRAHIKVAYRQIHLGVFDTKDQAIAARKSAEADYGFHANHGRAA